MIPGNILQQILYFNSSSGILTLILDEGKLTLIFDKGKRLFR